MEVNKYNHYRVNLKDRRIASIEINGQKAKSFVQPDNRSEPKLYIIKSGSEIVYIGKTTQNIRTRLWQGLTAQGEHGYYGYMWKDLPEVDILVWCFPGEDERYVETLEGELVFLYRKHTGKWPMHHMEIHFHNAKKDEVELAEAILREARG
jgi:predicted GIY-YIG superfamily endonuclease